MDRKSVTAAATVDEDTVVDGDLDGDMVIGDLDADVVDPGMGKKKLKSEQGSVKSDADDIVNGIQGSHSQRRLL